MRIYKYAAVAALLLTGMLLFAQASGNGSDGKSFDGKSWWDHVKFLASDELEGRETGSEGLKKAETYVVDELKKNGIEPAGENGYYQPIRFVERQLDEAKSSLELTRSVCGGQDCGPIPLTLGDDAMLSTRVEPAPLVEAPLVFVGYGLRVPEAQIDDFASLDVKGKVLVILTGSPSQLSPALSAHYQSTAERARVLKETGAIGYVMIPNPASMDIPWSRMKLARLHPSMGFADKSLNESAPAQIYVYFNPASAQKLFDASGHTFEELAALGKDRKPLPTFPLRFGIKATQSVVEKQIESSNVIGKLVGSDPKLRDQYVVLSAHVDHIGIGEPINGDKIYNGAMDNGSGTALLMDLAAALPKLHPKRSVLFVFVTAEEKGLLGSRYYAVHPTVPVKSMVADINTDMFLPIYPLKVLTVFGLAESTLGDKVTEIAKKNGVEVQPDPQPLRNVFIRSDQYNFVRDGVPSLMMMDGAKPGSPEEKTEDEWLHTRYHAPSDDINQPVDLEAAGKFEDIVRDLTMKVADDTGRPEWKSDSFFRRYAERQGK